MPQVGIVRHPARCRFSHHHASKVKGWKNKIMSLFFTVLFTAPHHIYTVRSNMPLLPLTHITHCRQKIHRTKPSYGQQPLRVCTLPPPPRVRNDFLLLADRVVYYRSSWLKPPLPRAPNVTTIYRILYYRYVQHITIKFSIKDKKRRQKLIPI